MSQTSPRFKQFARNVSRFNGAVPFVVPLSMVAACFCVGVACLPALLVYCWADRLDPNGPVTEFFDHTLPQFWTSVDWELIVLVVSSTVILWALFSFVIFVIDHFKD